MANADIKAVAAAWREKNRERIREVQRAWRERNAEHVREYGRKKYALDGPRKRQCAKDKPETRWRNAGYPTPTRPKPTTCDCCGKKPSTMQSKGELCLDHDHETGKFRGWLCGACNIGLGNLGDNLDGVSLAMAYLVLHGS